MPVLPLAQEGVWTDGHSCGSHVRMAGWAWAAGQYREAGKVTLGLGRGRLVGP